MDLDTRHGWMNRCRLEVEQTDGRCADEHKLVLELPGCLRIVDDITGRNVTPTLVFGEMNPKAAIAVGRYRIGADNDTVNTQLIALDDDVFRLGANA